jgi:hypothetical protein
MQWSWIILSCLDLHGLFVHNPQPHSHRITKGRISSARLWVARSLWSLGFWLCWGSTQSENDPRCTLKMNKKNATTQSSGVLKQNMTIPESLEENLGHVLGDCVLRMSREQTWFWSTEPLSLLNCGFFHIAVDFCWLPLLYSQLHVRVIPTSHVWVFIFVHLLIGFTVMLYFPRYLITTFLTVFSLDYIFSSENVNLFSINRKRWKNSDSSMICGIGWKLYVFPSQSTSKCRCQVRHEELGRNEL